ncbi:AzlC family ABC transporter permease [Aureimonas populi]|uniref:AzlC family ABC transporter permease n=1 Tax=Aureimonas populi TaxID=1701758 RepID=A0ABW5CQA1_9HYPH|nr:AzlC family ABC transporter permease [Aureimonas populi]
MIDRRSELPPPEQDDLRWFLKGARGIFSAPAMILVLSMIGFAGLARDAGISWTHASFMTFAIWALPAKIILVGAITAGASLPATALAVGLSSVRLMPMVVSLVPRLRAPRTRTRTLLILSHFVAITCWVFAMERIDRVPRESRVPFFAGFAITLTVVNTVVVALLFNLMGQLPGLVTGALAFLTPAYFLMSLFGSSRETTGWLGLLTGMALLPPANWLFPQFDILVAGIVGGILAYVGGRAIDRRRAGA